jgi:hypothetical protein
MAFKVRKEFKVRLAPQVRLVLLEQMEQMGHKVQQELMVLMAPTAQRF